MKKTSRQKRYRKKQRQKQYRQIGGGAWGAAARVAGTLARHGARWGTRGVRGAKWGTKALVKTTKAAAPELAYEVKEIAADRQQELIDKVLGTNKKWYESLDSNPDKSTFIGLMAMVLLFDAWNRKSRRKTRYHYPSLPSIREKRSKKQQINQIHKTRVLERMKRRIQPRLISSKRKV